MMFFSQWPSLLPKPSGMGLVSLLTAFLFSSLAQAVDPSPYLSSPLTVVQGGADQTYFGQDAYGNQLRVRQGALSALFGELGVNLFMQAIGVPTLPLYPVLLELGENGLPIEAENRMGLPSQQRPGSPDQRGLYFQGTAQHIAPELQAFQISALNSEQLLSFIVNMLAQYLVGNNEAQLATDGKGSIGFDGSHFVTLDGRKAFSNYENQAADYESFKKHFTKVSLAFSNLPRDTQINLLSSLNEFVSRIESLEPHQLEKLFDPFQRLVNQKNLNENQPQIQVVKTFQLLVASLRKNFSKSFPGFSQFSKIPSAKAHINLPSIDLSSQIPEAASMSPGVLLWGYYFEGDKNIRASAVEKWGKELGLDTSQVISQLQAQAAKRTPIDSFVGLDSATIPGIQLHLNGDNGKTLLVVPANDPEAKMAIEVGKRAGAQVLELRLAHGSKITNSLVSQIAELIKKGKVERLLILELPGETPLNAESTQEEETLRKLVKTFIPVDHHTYYSEGMDRFQPISSLEQVAHHLGYDLSLPEFFIAVEDRSFVPGLMRAGMPYKALQEDLLQDQVLLDMYAAAKTLRAYETPYGKIYALDGRQYRGKIGQIAGALSLVTYPEIPNLLVYGTDSLKFSGHVAIRTELASLFEANENESSAHYSGGDPELSVFWGAKGMSKGALLQMEQQIESKLGMIAPSGKANYKIFGEEHSRTIVLIHGLDSAWQTFYPILDTLKEKFRVVAIDLPGHGQSADPASDSFSNLSMAKAVDKVLEELKIVHATVLGHSLGGRVAVKLAHEFPHRVGKLIIEDMELLARGRGRKSEFSQERMMALKTLPISFKDKEAVFEALGGLYTKENIESLIGRRILQQEDGSYLLLWRPHISPQFAMASNSEDLSTELAPSLETLVLMPLDIRESAISGEGLLDLRDRNNVTIAQIPNATHNVHGSQTKEYLTHLLKFVHDDSEKGAKVCPLN